MERNETCLKLAGLLKEESPATPTAPAAPATPATNPMQQQAQGQALLSMGPGKAVQQKLDQVNKTLSALPQQNQATMLQKYQQLLDGFLKQLIAAQQMAQQQQAQQQQVGQQPQAPQ